MPISATPAEPRFWEARNWQHKRGRLTGTQLAHQCRMKFSPMLVLAAALTAGCASHPISQERESRIVQEALDQQKLERAVEQLRTKDQRFKRAPHF